MKQGIVINNLSKSFIPGRFALNPFDLEIHPGKITGIVGPDGAGKTTLMRLISTILIPSSGTICINGYDTQTESQQLYSRIGYMPQRFGLYEDLTVIENLKFYADLRDINRNELKTVLDKYLEFTHLAPFQKRFAGKLSGGMKQKLGLACALLKDPEVLILDEPSVGVDPISRRDLWNMVKHLANQGTTVLWSTSYLDEAESCDDIVFLNAGSVLFSGKPQEITKRVEGRVFLTTSSPENKRQFLKTTIADQRVVDSVILGDYIKVVLEKDQDIKTIADENITWKNIKPNFEDGFIDFLSFDKVRSSTIADAIDMIADHKEAVIEVKNLKKVFGEFTAVNGVSFRINQGEIFGFLGPNGAGKSTTFKMLCGLLRPTEGTAKVLGISMHDSPELARQKIGYMGQKFSLYGTLSVHDNLSFFAGLYGLSPAEQKRAIKEMIDIFSLKDFLHAIADSLSLGYKQRLSLACALMHRPEILFLDEPTSGVDPVTRREFWLHINSLAQKGITIMVTTHFMEEAEYCDRISLIYKGNVIAEGTPDQLKKRSLDKANPNPTLEDSFIKLVRNYDHLSEEISE